LISKKHNNEVREDLEFRGEVGASKGILQKENTRLGEGDPSLSNEIQKKVNNIVSLEGGNKRSPRSERKKISRKENATSRHEPLTYK